MKQNYLFSLFLFMALSCFLLGCNKENAKEMEENLVKESEVFTLTATYGTADTKVAFDEDGLGLSWAPGDCLYLVDLAGKNRRVVLKTDITSPAKRATFTSTTSVLSGDYIVMYGSSVISSLYPYNTLTTDAGISSHILLYGYLSVSDGQTSASIILNHCFAKLKFSFKNYPTGLTQTSFGMAVSKDGIPFLGNLSSDGYNTSSYCTMVPLGGNNINSGMSVLATPNDYSGSTVLFYCYGTLNGKHVTYEIQKPGRSLSAGNNYNIEFDFSKAKVSTIESELAYDNIDGSYYIYSLNSTVDFRAAAYWNKENCYRIDSDIDFKDDIYIPIKSKSVDGNKHSIKNVTIDYSKCDSIGLFSCGTVTNLALNNAMINGRNKVGAIVGSYGSVKGGISVCIVKGDVNISGFDYVGGIVGHVEGRGSLSVNVQNCGFEGNVEGQSYVGGICGYFQSSSSQNISSCYMKGDVSGIEYVGGICGYINGPSSTLRVYSSYHIGNVGANSNSVGGICGGQNKGQFEYCYSYGSVTNDIGICPSFSYNTTSNLTSSSKLFDGMSSTLSDYCNCSSTKTFLSKINVINGNESYSTQVWPGIDAQCPILQWQSDALNGDIDIPGYNDIDW